MIPGGKLSTMLRKKKRNVGEHPHPPGETKFQRGPRQLNRTSKELPENLGGENPKGGGIPRGGTPPMGGTPRPQGGTKFSPPPPGSPGVFPGKDDLAAPTKLNPGETKKKGGKRSKKPERGPKKKCPHRKKMRS